MSITVPLDSLNATSALGGQIPGTNMSHALLMSPSLLMQGPATSATMELTATTFMTLASVNGVSTTTLALTATDHAVMAALSSHSTLTAILTAADRLATSAMASISQTQGTLMVSVKLLLDASGSLSHTSTLALGATPQLGLSPLGSLSDMEMTVVVPVLIAGLNAQSASAMSNIMPVVPTFVPAGATHSASTMSLFLTTEGNLVLNPINSISDLRGVLGVTIGLDSLIGRSHTSNIYPIKPDHLISPVINGWIARYPDGILTNLPDYEYDLVPAYEPVPIPDPFYRTK